LTSEGIRTLAIAIPPRASIESSRNTASLCVNARPNSPTTTASRDTSVTRCTPAWRAAAGARAPKAAKASTGSEVSRPTAGVDMPRPSRTSERTGPTLTAAGRRFADSSTRPRSSQREARREDAVT
jgi:hypothetical protein